jgi:hypothetical protein
VIRRPAALSATVAAAAVMTLTGCNATNRELTIVFTAGTTDAQRTAALRACTGAAPHTSPEPVPTPTSTRGILRYGAPIRFRIDQASDRDIARLEECLQKQPGVQGFQDSAA